VSVLSSVFCYKQVNEKSKTAYDDDVDVQQKEVYRSTNDDDETDYYDQLKDFYRSDRHDWPLRIDGKNSQYVKIGDDYAVEFDMFGEKKVVVLWTGLSFSHLGYRQGN